MTSKRSRIGTLMVDIQDAFLERRSATSPGANQSAVAIHGEYGNAVATGTIANAGVNSIFRAGEMEDRWPSTK
jgi:hypothetical protein